MRKELTKEELRKEIEEKISKAKPMVKREMMAYVKRADKKELEGILKTAKVSRDGWNISLD